MIMNNLKFIVRRLIRQKKYTYLNLLGLTLGLSTCLVIGLFLAYELSFDSYHQKADRIYRINEVKEAPSYGIKYKYAAPAPLAKALREEVSGIEAVASVYPQEAQTIEVATGKLFQQEGILLAESDIIDVFDFDLIEGDARQALRQPWQAILTASTAKKFFGQEDPMGKTLTYDGRQTITVAGIMKDLPNNTHLAASMLISYLVTPEYMGFNLNQWTFTFGASTYVALQEGVTPESLETPIQAVYDKYANTDPESLEKSRGELQALSHIHLEPKYAGGGQWVQAINPRWLWFFAVVGIIVLLLASINFVNLSTAQALTRAKEVAIRKTIGAARSHLLSQFVIEALILVSIASVLALGITYYSLGYLNQSLDKDISLWYLLNPTGISIFIGGVLLTALLTGIYPAWLISKFQPVTALKGSWTSTGRSSNFLSKALVTIQFTVSGAMFIALFFIAQQLTLFYNQSLGFDRDNILLVKAPDASKYDVLASELTQMDEIKHFSFMSTPPSGIRHNKTHMYRSDDPTPQTVNMVFGDEQYPKLFDFQLIAGRYFEARDTSAGLLSLPRDQRFPKAIVNENLIKVLGLGASDEAIGKRFKIGWNGWQPEIVGVVKDFSTNSLHDPVEPVVIFQQNGFYESVCIKVKANSNMPQTLASIQAAWQKAFPQQYYDYEFLDDKLASHYESESQLLSFFQLFAGIAILISCLGLWGLATHAAVQRTKEIGIRKVLGASVSGIVTMMSKDFLKLIGLAVLLSVPLAWYFTDQWLQSFTYRIDMQWWVFAVASLLVLLLAFLTVSMESMKSALANPLDCIREE
ncbi:MAG: ABC transporter permease [Saprospiraceae bacterium]|nr:ABC transporter permease [Saprospiraceae bacterium]